MTRPPAQPNGRAQRPNIVLVLIDDMGFGASSVYGGPCQMPTAQRIADEGLQFTRFHVTSLCSPTRQALLTGRNHHSVGMGVTTEMSTQHPGYNGRRPESAAPLARLLRDSGYTTAAFGKWHQTPPSEVGPDGQFDRWPVGEGFEYFYGFMGAEMNHWYPLLFENTTPVVPERTPEQGYHLSEDLVEHAVDWITEAAGERPFLTYLALGATHAPFHVAPEWIDRHRGEFDDGWNAQRERILARQKEIGIVPPETELSPWPKELPLWDDLDDERRSVAARFMETYAGFAEHADAQVGRVLDALEASGVADDTIVLYLLGDNGASGEGGVDGTLREHLVGHGIPDSSADMAQRLEEFGSAQTYGLYPAGWALAMNTPYPWTKQIASHYGGTRDGAVLRWPAGIEDTGLRHQWHHVIDVLPTLLEVAGVSAPEQVDGVDQQPIEGTSMAYVFDDAQAADRRHRQYFEMVGNRAIYDDGWVAAARHGIAWEMVGAPRPFEDDVWQLYDTTTDWSQARDVADQHPQRLARMQELFLEQARAHQVLPLDDRVTERENPVAAGRAEADPRTEFRFTADTRRVGEELAPNVKNRSHELLVTVDITDGDTGTLLSQGGAFGGWSLYVHQGLLCYAYNLYGRDLTILRGIAPIPAGRRVLGARFDFDGGPAGAGAQVTLSIDGEPGATTRLAATTAYYFSFDETFDVGVDLGTPVSPDQRPGATEFTGTLHEALVRLLPVETTLDAAQQLRARIAHQ
ncbi:arylsulfatase [Dermacoccaceae bacterium W4C1]